jgi:hypothetical protein
MSLRMEAAIQDLTRRIEALEAAARPAKIVKPKHLGFGKWGLQDNSGQLIDSGPYSKEAAQKAAQVEA